MVTNISEGLTSAQYQNNLKLYGLNTLPEAKPPSKLVALLSQFTDPLVSILIIAAVLTLVVQFFEPHFQSLDFSEFLGIMAVVLINGILGFIQENQAEATLQSLTKSIKSETNVIRNGSKLVIDIKELTVGDVVELKLGDKVPADGIILQATDVSADEAVLTGESEPVAKQVYADSFDIVSPPQVGDEFKLFMGTSVMSGICRIVVTSIGTHTKFGQIADSLATETVVDTPLQARLKTLTKYLTLFIGIISIVMLAWGILTGLPLSEILELTISIAVSSIPEGLIIALTVILSLGMRRILKRKAVVRKLVAAETLGSVDTICIDKTGTLTEGRMQVVQTFFQDNQLAKRALVATNHQINSVEIATMNWLRANLTAREEAEFRQENYLEYKIFDSTTKFSATRGAEFTYFVGAPEEILKRSTQSSDQKKYWEKEIKDFSIKGMRLVALGYQPTAENKFSTTALPDQINWLGIIVIEDPIRPNLNKVFAQAAQAGIAVKVITGDFGETARAVLNKIEIDLKGNEMISGKELEALTDRELSKRIDQIKLFYRTSPSQKLRIIKTLQQAGHVVAMMGDGINDTPALKKAEIGIVVENATDFSKEIADMVLIDSNFRTIIAAIEEGRSIFENLRRVLTYLLVDAFDAVILVMGSLFLGLPTPLLPLQILYINFLTDGLPDLALAFEKPEHEVMRDKPRPKNYPLLDSEVRTMVLTIGIIVTSAILGLYILLLNQGVDQTYARSLIMMTVGVNSLIYVFPIKSFRKNLWHINPFENKLLLAGVGVGLVSLILATNLPVLQKILGTVPITLSDWGIVFGIGIFDVLIVEIIKSYYIRRNQKL